METFDEPGDTIFSDELWWVMILEANSPGQAKMQERYYLSESGSEGCKRVLQDVQRSSTIPMLAVNLDQLDGILARFEKLDAQGEILEVGEDKSEAWLVWMDKGGDEGVQEVWTYTKDPHEAEMAAMQKVPGASPLLRAGLTTLTKAKQNLQRILGSNHWSPIWLDLRDPPRHLNPAELLERKQVQVEN